MKGMAVCVGEAGQHDAGQSRRAGGIGVGGDRRESSAVDLEHDVARDATRQPRVGGEVGRQEARSSSTVVSASTPAKQSAVSAYSTGECETPVGLRTNNIALGIPAVARIPA